MFTALPAAPPDPILGLSRTFEQDSAPDKIDLGVGVYRDESGRSPVLASVKLAEKWLLERQATKSYLSSSGEPAFNSLMQELLFGADHGVIGQGRVRTLQTPGGSGALRVAAELIRRCRPGATVWIPDPSWANHSPIMLAAGLKVRVYPYYDIASARLTWGPMQATLTGVAADDVVLIQGCCHNPSGADLSLEQWSELGIQLRKTGAVPFVDLAYQGFGQGVDEDAAGLRLLAADQPELLVATSCSKTFSLYRERTGSLSLVARNGNEADRAAGNALTLVRAMYSMPPDHGAAVVAHILGTAELRRQWLDELRVMRERIQSMRRGFAAELSSVTGEDYTWIERQYGMFSLLNLTPPAVRQLREVSHVHAIGSGRINLAGLSKGSLTRAAQAVAAALQSHVAV